MKRAILNLVFLLICLVSFSQNRVYITFNKCKGNHEEIADLVDYKLFKFDSLLKESTSNNFEFIDSLVDGKYYIEYLSIFGYKKTKLFSLNEHNSTETLKLCVDKIDKSNELIKSNNFFEKMKSGEEIKIKYEFAGCFNEGSDSIIVQKTKSNYFLVYKNDKYKIDHMRLNTLKDYETELINLKVPEQNCTVGARNTITYNKLVIEFIDTCNFWNGFGNLLKELKL